MSGLDEAEQRMADAIEPWFGEDAGTVAILLQAMTLPEARADLASRFTAQLGGVDASALLAAINRAAAPAEAREEGPE